MGQLHAPSARGLPGVPARQQQLAAAELRLASAGAALVLTARHPTCVCVWGGGGRHAPASGSPPSCCAGPPGGRSAAHTTAAWPHSCMRPTVRPASLRCGPHGGPAECMLAQSSTRRASKQGPSFVETCAAPLLLSLAKVALKQPHACAAKRHPRSARGTICAVADAPRAALPGGEGGPLHERPAARPPRRHARAHACM